MLEVRELLVKAFATAWKNSDQSTDRDTYINSSITVIDSMQVQPEMIYAEEGQILDQQVVSVVIQSMPLRQSAERLATPGPTNSMTLFFT